MRFRRRVSSIASSTISSSPVFDVCVCVCVLLILKEKGVRVLKKAEKRDNKNFQKFEKIFT
jgi:hypothetical protein